MAIGRRLRIATRWLRGQRNGVSATELARFLTGPTCAVSSREFIVGTEQGDNDTIAFRVRGVDRPLIWPTDQPRYSLFMVLSEALDPTNWHFYETPETRVTEDDVVADCGAAEGLFALLVQPRARHVFAIEPAPHWTTALRRTFADAPNVTVLPVGLGAAPGRAYLTGGTLDSAISTTPGGEGHEITVETIDRLFADRDQALTYLKADLEGFELAMLAGAEQTIARYRPKIAITTYHQASHAKQITEFLLGIEPRYQIRTKGIDAETGSPVMLHAWMPTPTT
jgi:FkbM family methyltransferase